MCGIAGFIGTEDGFAPAKLTAMRDALKHRGPDDAGARMWRRDGEQASDGEAGWGGLAHRRLSIIDLSAAGHQPMCNEDGALWIAYNGEFYNFGDYRAELEQRGHTFRSHSDTETILHLFEDRGIEKTLAAMNGMFAFALWDSTSRRLVLARDRVGKKPLYYVHRSDGSLYFASEIKALIAAGVVDCEQIDELGFDQSLTFGGALGDRTFFAQVRQIPAGHFAVWGNGKLAVTRYFDPPFANEQPDESRSLDDLADELEALLVDAIRLRLVSDVPVGLFLSGGIDSSIVAALTSRVLKQQLRAFTISFSERDYDESPHAKAVADALNLPITITPVRSDDVALFEFAAGHTDQPLGDASAVPTHLVSRAARAGVTVALTGDGGDELFGGYDAYRVGLRLWGRGAQKLTSPNKLTPMEKLWELRMKLRGFEQGYLHTQCQFSARQKKALYRDGVDVARLHRETLASKGRHFEAVRGRDLLSQMQHIGISTLMVDVILRKVDMMSMACALECRSPLLDHRVLSFCARLPHSAKMDPWGRGKLLLRHLLFRHVDEKLFNRPKQGFVMPWERVCTGSYALQLRDRWRALDLPMIRPESGAWLFPESGGSMFRMWSGLSVIRCMEKARGK